MSIGRVPGATGIQPSIVTAKGDLIVATASGSVTNQAVGSNNQVLTADSAQADGVKWANGSAATLTTTGDLLYASAANTPARLGIGSSSQVLTVSGGVPTWATPSSGGMTLLSTTTLSGTSTTISGISGSYNELRIHISNITYSGDSYTYMRFNSDANANRYFSAGGDQGTAQLFNQDKMQLTTFNDQTTSKGVIVMTIPMYAQTDNWKLVERCSFMQDSDNANNIGFSNRINGWNQTSAITSITFLTADTPSYTSGTVKIYGVK